MKKFGEALENKDFEGKSDSDVFKELTQNDGDAFKGVTVVKLAGGTARPTGANIPAKDEFKKMSYNKKLELYQHNARQKFCCKDCCTNATNDRRRKKRYAEKGNHTFKQKNCKLCGKPFRLVNGQEVSCSQECKKKNRNQKQPEY